MYWRPFDAMDLRGLILQPAQWSLSDLIRKPSYGRDLQSSGPGFTLTDGETVLVCAGLVRVWEDRAQAWSLLGAGAGRHMVTIYRGMSSFLAMQKVARIEATVDTDFEAGHRLARMLGFVREGTMRAYNNGRDADLYSRVMP